MRGLPPSKVPPRRARRKRGFKRPLLPPELAENMIRMRAAFEDAVAPTTAPLQTVTRKVDKGNLGRRVVTGLSLAAITALMVYLGVSWFAVLSMGLVSVGIIEFCTIAGRKGVQPSRGLAVTAGLVILAAYAWAPLPYLGNIVAITMISTMMCYLFRRDSDGGLIEPRLLDGMLTIGAYLYVAWTFGFAFLLRRLDGQMELAGISFDAGAVYLYMLIMVVAFSDIGCYAFGKAFGKHPLAPRISPGKTVEGSLGGIFMALLFSWGFGSWVGWEWRWSLVYGLGVGIASQLGDLWESAFKRDAGVKDSGRLLAGHGGVLDRFDSYFFAAPIAYFLIVWIMYPY